MLDMFHSAAIKLTVWYLTIVMCLSIGFSGIVYHFADNELVQNTRRQVFFLNQEVSPSDFQGYSKLRQTQLMDSENKLKANFIIFNLMVLVGGGVASYALARRTLRPIEESHERQKRFASDASHELRTPLTAMQTEIEVALRNKRLGVAGARQLLASNLEEVAKLKTLAESLLSLDNQDAVEPDSPVSLKDIARMANERLAKAARQKKISIKTEIRDCLVRGDEKSLAELVAILLDNAIKYSPDGSSVTISGGKKGKSGFLRVADQGQGIVASDLPSIFNRFYRADSSRSKSSAEGYGLGLSIAKKIVDTHKGHIEVTSAVGKGSSFTIFLPSA